MRWSAPVLVLLLLRRALAAGCVTVMLSAAAAGQDRFIAPVPPDGDLTIHKDVEYRKAGDRRLSFDLYRPRTDRHPQAVPVAIFLNGIGADWMRQHTQYSGWVRYATTAGLAGVAMDATEDSPAADFDALMTFLRANAVRFGIDPDRLVVWSCSANVRTGAPLVEDPGRSAIKAAVFYYGTGPVNRFRLDLPLLVVRAGRDNPGLNADIDALLWRALTGNAPVSVINHASGQHGFDIRDDNDLSRDIMQRTLAFMSSHVLPGVRKDIDEGTMLARAAAALTAKDWLGARAAYESLAASRPADPDVHQRLGEVLAELGDLEGAARALERSADLGTTNGGIVNFALVQLYTRRATSRRPLPRSSESIRRCGFFSRPSDEEPGVLDASITPEISRDCED